MGAIKLLSYLIVFGILFTSCSTTNKVAYFQNSQNNTYNKKLDTVEATLQNNMFLRISITSLNAVGSSIFNPFAPPLEEKTANAKADGKDNYVGYLINSTGYIEIPNLGKIKAAGLTKTQLKDLLTKQILDRQLLREPRVDVRLLNFEVTILGEVANPAVVSVPSEKISLIKALGMAGDITIYGKKDNVLVIREINGQRITKRINLYSGDFLNSDYYYLQPNDVVYVEPNKAKVAVSGRSAQVLPLALSSLSILVFVLDKVIK